MAATNIAKLSVLFSSDGRQFDKGIKKSLKGANASFKKWANTTKVAAGAVAGALTGIVASATKAADSLAKTSAKLGMTTTELAGLRYAAELSGVGVTQLDTGLQRIIRRTSEAAVGVGEARGALKELGIDAAKFNSLSQSEKVFELADAFEAVESSGDKVRLMMKLADTEGVGLVNTLALGSDKLRAMQVEAQRLGLAFEDGAAAKFEKFGDQITVVQKQFVGLKNTIATEMLPILSEFNGMLGELTMAERYKIFNRTVESMFNKIVAGFQDTGSTFLHFRADIVDGVKTFIDSNRGIIDGFIGVVEKVVNASLKGLSKLLLKATMGLNSLIMKANEVAGTSVDGFTFSGFGQVQLPRSGDMSSVLGDRSAELRESAASMAAAAEFSRKMADGAERDIERIKKAAAEAGEITGEGVDDIIEGLGETVKTGGAATKSAVEDAADAMDELKDKAIETENKITKSWDSAMGDMSSGIKSALEDGKTQWSNFGDWFRSWTASTVADYLADWAAGMAKRIAMEAATMASKSSVGWVSTLGALFTGGLTGKAAGGAVSGSVPYLVGERGPEVVIPGGNSEVIPNHKLGGMGGGGVTVNQVFNTGVSEAQLFEATRATYEAAKRGVAEAVSRGGGYRRQLQY